MARVSITVVLVMNGALIFVLVRLFAQEPTHADGVFLPAAVAPAPEQDLMRAEAADEAEFLDDASEVVGREVMFMPRRASTATWQPSRSPAEFLGPRRPPIWFVRRAAPGPEAFMSLPDFELRQPNIFMPAFPQAPGPQIFMIGAVPTLSLSTVFMSTTG